MCDVGQGDETDATRLLMWQLRQPKLRPELRKIAGSESLAC
jgi:hypothetical protein